MDQQVASRRRTDVLTTFQPTWTGSAAAASAPRRHLILCPVPTTGPPVLRRHVASAGTAMRWLNSSRALRLCDKLASSAVTASISPSAKRL